MEIIDFLIEAKNGCYVGGGPKVTPFRPNAKDLKYEKYYIMIHMLEGKLLQGKKVCGKITNLSG